MLTEYTKYECVDFIFDLSITLTNINHKTIMNNVNHVFNEVLVLMVVLLSRLVKIIKSSYFRF